MKTIHIGTSGWLYPGWAGTFYKEKVRTYEALTEYATHFSTTENNSAFYHIPRPLTLQKWYDATPENFIFSIKLNKFFTHEHKLRLDDITTTKLDNFLLATQELRQKLGAILIQTPPSLRCNMGLLEEFIATLMEKVALCHYRPDIALEFRHGSWQNDEVYEMLKHHDIIWVISHSSVYPYARIITAPFLYIRLHGPEQLFASAYGEAKLKEWADFVKTSPVEKVYIYFNNTMNVDAVKDAALLQKLLAI